MSEQIKPGWLGRRFRECNIDVATWPKYLREQFDDAELSSGERKEAAKRLRARADELDPRGELSQ